MSRGFKLRRDLGERAVAHAKRSWPEFVILLGLIAGVLVLYAYRRALFGVDTPVRLAAGIALVILGWAAAAAPVVDAQGPQLTNEVLAALRDIATDHR